MCAVQVGGPSELGVRVSIWYTAISRCHTSTAHRLNNILSSGRFLKTCLRNILPDEYVPPAFCWGQVHA
jgi:hypothetical protein